MGAPISQMIKEHVKLVRKLRKYSFSDTAQIVAGLSLCPNLHANTIRIEVLQHLLAVACVGRAVPNRDDLVNWLAKEMAKSSAAKIEDPVEDVFVGCISSEFGNFRVFSGIFADGDFWMGRLLDFLAEKQDFPPFEFAIKSLLPLLKLSDAIVERIGLVRYCPGGGSSYEHIEIPQWKNIVAYAKAVHFSETDLASLGISSELLRGFFLTDDQKCRLQEEEVWNSSLERFPLLRVVDGLLVSAPSSIIRAAIRFSLDLITKSMGGWADTFFEIETATVFVNEVRLRLEIMPMNFEPPPWPKDLQPMFPYFGFFDTGKPVIMLTYCTPLSKSAAAFDGFENFSIDEKLTNYLGACAKEFEKNPGFSGGLVLICFANIGYNLTVGLNKDLPNWNINVATLPEWLALTALGNCTAMRLWKLNQHELSACDRGLKIVNLAGLLNLYAFWKSNGFRIVPQDADPRSLNLLSLNCDFATGLRVNTKQIRDVHAVRSHDGRAWVKLTRHNSQPLFKEDSEMTMYANHESAANGNLVGCVERKTTNWWVAAPPRQDNPDLTGLVFQIWECVEFWVARVALVLEVVWPPFTIPSIEIKLHLLDLSKWSCSRSRDQSNQTEDLSIAVDVGLARIDLIIPEQFLNKFRYSQECCGGGYRDWIAKRSRKFDRQ